MIDDTGIAVYWTFMIALGVIIGTVLGFIL